MILYCLLLLIRGSAGSFVLFRYFSSVVLHPRDLQVSQYVVSLESSSLIHHGSYSSYGCFLCMLIH